MKTVLLTFLALGAASAQPVLNTVMRNGIQRADLRHTATGNPVTDDNPASIGESLIAAVSGLSGDATVFAAGQTTPGIVLDDGSVQFSVPDGATGSFAELSIASAAARSNAATFPIAAADPSQLSADDVQGLTERAAAAIDDPRMAVAVVDRAGRPLSIYRKPQATDATVETAFSLARTGAFFSHNQAPLSSRTVATLSMEHFPNGIPNQAAAPLFGIENTNRGCDFNAAYLPGQLVPPAKNAAGTGPGVGITTIPGGIPVYKNGLMVGGIGAAGVDSNAAEFAVVAATLGTTFFVPLPLPDPGAIFINGVRLPYVNQTTRPAGTSAGSAPGGQYQVGPLAGNAMPDGYLIGPIGSSTLSTAEVSSIVQNAIDTALKTRAAIRLPLGTRARFAISVTDLNGNVLALYRMFDATVFSDDVSVAKARNVIYFSSQELDPRDLPGVPVSTAVTNRTINFGSQSFFPSGIDDSRAGPFRDVYLFDKANPCTQGRQPANPNQNGIVFFPGSAPLYKNGGLVGGLGVSGDGVDQDDWVTAAGAKGYEPPAAIRADQVFIRGVRLPYWKFPRNPEQ